MVTTQPRPIFVFDNPRTRSHLFWRWIGTHPDLRTEYHPYLLAAHLGPLNFYRDIRCSVQRRKVIDEFEAADVTDTFESANRDLQRLVSQSSPPVCHRYGLRSLAGQSIAEVDPKEKRLFVSDHCHRLFRRDLLFSVIRTGGDLTWPPQSNPTLIPNPLMAALVPIILIRHPIFTVPSFYKTMTKFNLSFEPYGEDMRLQTTLQYARMIFDYLRTLSGFPPLVVDGDDIVWRADELKDGLCKGLGLESTSIQENWKPTPIEERPSNEYIWQFTKVAHESTGIQQLSSQPTIPSIEEAFEDWSLSYGSDVASQLRSLVEAEMSHYDYLKQFKI